MRRFAARTLLFAAAAVSMAAQTPVKILGHTPPLSYVRWTDPRENAFSAEVPRGWTVTGGLIRNSPIDTRQTVQLTSPDGQIRITFGDARVPAYVMPNPMLHQTGFPEGTRYPNGMGTYNVVRRYVSGVAFAEEYARNGSGTRCDAMQVLDRRDRPELAESLNRLLANMPGVVVRLNTGEVAYTCGTTAQPGVGYYFAGTLSTQGANGLGMWFLYLIHGFVAPARGAAVAQAALRHLVNTHAVNPKWAATQSKITMDSVRINAQTNAETAGMISKSYWNQQKSLDRVFRNDANARRGTTDVADPNTGETWNVTGGSRYYWRKPGSDAIVGTDSPTPPGMGYVQLNEY